MRDEDFAVQQLWVLPCSCRQPLPHTSSVNSLPPQDELYEKKCWLVIGNLPGDLDIIYILRVLENPKRRSGVKRF